MIRVMARSGRLSEDDRATVDAVVHDGGAGIAVVDHDRVGVQVDPHYIVVLGGRANGVDVDTDELVVATLDLGRQIEVDEEQPAHVLDHTLDHRARAVHGVNVGGLPTTVRDVGPDDHSTQGLDREGRAFGVFRVELEHEGADVGGGVLGAVGTALGLADRESVAHLDRSIDGFDRKRTGPSVGRVCGIGRVTGVTAVVGVARIVVGVGRVDDLVAVAVVVDHLTGLAGTGGGRAGGEGDDGGEHDVAVHGGTPDWVSRRGMEAPPMWLGLGMGETDLPEKNPAKQVF